MKVQLSVAPTAGQTSPYRYGWSGGPWPDLVFSPDKTSSSVEVIMPDVDSNDPVEQRKVTIEVKVKGANGIVSRGRHVITVVP